MVVDSQKLKDTGEDDKVEKKAEEKIEVKKEDKPGNEKLSTMDKINNFLLRFSGVPQKEILFFLEYLRVMLKAGISLAKALRTLADQTQNKRFSKILKQVASSVEKGVSLTDSLRAHPKIFGELFINMIEAGEISGSLENVLEQLYIQMKKNHELKSKVRGALTYPIIVMTAMLGIGTFMIIFVVPKITEMFKEFDAELPLPTKILIKVSDTLVQNGIISLILLAGFIFLLTTLLKTKKGKYCFETLVLKMPIISPIIKKINLARFARTVSSLLKADIMIVKTFQISSKVIGNLHYRYALLEVSDKIKKGKKISEIIGGYPKLFTPVVIQMTEVGEETGEIDSILGELAEFYESEINQTMENLPSIIEPLIILVLACGIGGMAVAIIMPMYSLTSSI